MQSILIFAVLLFAANAFAQGVPQVGNKPPVQVKPKGPVSCKALGTVEGRKLWAGGCVGVPKQNGGPLDARAQRRNEARRPLDAPPPEEEKTWWNW
jgi:hypothetical protein